MLITDKFYYIELQKTGCTHTRNILMSLPGLNTRTFGVHNSYGSLNKNQKEDFKAKLKVGNIRNPWDWYVSLWAYGCMQKGGLYANLVEKPDLRSLRGLGQAIRAPYRLFSNKGIWEEVYADPYNADLFRRWLKLILIGENIKLGEGYKSTGLSHFAGLLTYRYLKLFTYRFNNIKGKLNDFEALESFYLKHNFLQVCIRNESLEKDLLDNAEKLGIDSGELKTVLAASGVSANSSQRREYHFYYDDETQNLVAEKERLIIKQFGYEF